MPSDLVTFIWMKRNPFLISIPLHKNSDEKQKKKEYCPKIIGSLEMTLKTLEIIQHI